MIKAIFKLIETIVTAGVGAVIFATITLFFLAVFVVFGFLLMVL